MLPNSGYRMNAREVHVYEKEHWEDGVKPASRGIKIAIFGIDLVLLITGITLIVLGIELNSFVSSSSPLRPDLPPIWALGILPIVLGLTGIICLALRRRKWILLWLVTSVVLGLAGFSCFVIFNFLNPHEYGINIQIFGNCEDDGSNCKCLWEDNKSVVGLLRSPCDFVRRASSLYLGLVLVFIVSIGASIICAILACVLVFCLRFCAPQDNRDIDLHTTIYGANSRPQISRRVGTQDTALCSPDTQYFLVACEDSSYNQHRPLSYNAPCHTSVPDSMNHLAISRVVDCDQTQVHESCDSLAHVEDITSDIT